MANENWKPLTSSELSDWRALYKDFPSKAYYKQIGQDALPNSMPKSLKQKIDNCVVMASGTPEGDVVMVCNLCRVDQKDSAVDQQPFAIVFDSHGHAESGVYLDHGNWPERTSSPQSDFWRHVDESGIGNYFYPSLPDGSQSGTLESLPETSHRAAFNEMVSRMQRKNLIDPKGTESR
ncbi:hypothetical protein [Gimesia sp.]|uniref:hypothetical protein n=1 Tax=Gimesia sp. TaxID=2024833 RepID=UPI0032ED495C